MPSRSLVRNLERTANLDQIVTTALMQFSSLDAQVAERLLDAGIADEETETVARDLVSGILGSLANAGRRDCPRDDQRPPERNMNAQHTPADLRGERHVLETGRHLFGIEVKTPETAVRDLILSGDVWLAACAVAAAGELRMHRLAPDIRRAAENTGMEVAEVARSVEPLLAA